MSDWLDVSRLIRDAVDMLEPLMATEKAGTRRSCEMQLAWHSLMHANSLLSTGRPTPDDLMWGYEQAEAITKEYPKP